jgi:hypothetical protein
MNKSGFLYLPAMHIVIFCVCISHIVQLQYTEQVFMNKNEILWTSCISHTHYVLLVQWTNQLLPATRGSGMRPGSATHTLELGLPVSCISLQW